MSDIKNMENEMNSEMEKTVLMHEQKNKKIAAEHEAEAVMKQEAQKSAEDFRREVNELLELYPELRERFAALVLCDIAVPPNANEDEFVSCTPVFIGQKMTEEREGKPYAILLEPIAAGEIGRAMILGVTPAKVTINSSDDDYNDNYNNYHHSSDDDYDDHYNNYYNHYHHYNNNDHNNNDDHDNNDNHRSYNGDDG